MTTGTSALPGITANRRLFCAGLTAAAFAPAAIAAELPKASAPVVARPRIVGPIPVTATSQPFATSQKPGSASAVLTQRHDYIEEEYFISGTANVYGPGTTKGLSAFMGEGKARSFATAKMQPLAGLAQAAAPYSTRMLLVRPRDKAKFSGRVHLYAFHNIAAQMPVDSNLLENGDAIACVEGCSGTRFGPQEIPSGGVAHLLKFNPERYRDMKLAHADPAVWPDLTPGTLGRMASSLDFGGAGQASDVFLQEIYRSYAQAPDIVTQMAHAIRSGDPALPFGKQVKGLYNFAASGGTTFQQPYIQYHHAAGMLPDGTPPFDGYLVSVGMLPETMPRNSVLVYLTSEADLITTLQLKTVMPPDSDSPRVRVYEIPGTGHGISAPRAEPSAVEENTASHREEAGVLPPGVAGLSERDEPPPGVVPFDKFNAPIVWALWKNMYDWVEKGTPMPRAARIVRDPNSPDGIALDEHGHGRGGLRTPWVDVPEANYLPRISPKNPLSAGMRPFAEEKIVQLYGSRENYLKLVKEKVDAMVRDRFVRPEHAAMMLESA